MNFATRWTVMLLFAALPGFAALVPVLDSARSFAVLAGSTVTNTGATSITGDVGVSPGAAVTGFPPGTVTGTTYSGGAIAAQAQADLAAASLALSTTTLGGVTSLPTQELGSLSAGGPATLTPGIYSFAASSTALLTGTLVLDAQNTEGAYWVFQIPTTLTTASSSIVNIINPHAGGDTGIYWVVGTSATLGTNSAFAGNIVAQDSISLTTGATVNGSALAQNGAVTMDTNTIVTGYSGGLAFDGANLVATPEPSTFAAFALGLLTLCGYGSRRKLAAGTRWARVRPALGVSGGKRSR